MASFCASETAETGRIANGCEQGDHVSRSRLRPATSVQNSIDYAFFVTFPALVPKPVYGATHFFGCFEPVRKGYCSADARPIFFENGLLYCKLTGASRIQKGQLLVIFVVVGICFCSVLIKCLEVSPRFLAFTQSCSALIESFDLSQSLVFVQKFRSI